MWTVSTGRLLCLTSGRGIHHNLLRFLIYKKRTLINRCIHINADNGKKNSISIQLPQLLLHLLHSRVDVL